MNQNNNNILIPDYAFKLPLATVLLIKRDPFQRFGLSKIFLAITIAAFKKYNIENIYSHLDSSSISVHGDSDFSQNEDNSTQS